MRVSGIWIRWVQVLVTLPVGRAEGELARREPFPDILEPAHVGLQRKERALEVQSRHGEASLDPVKPDKADVSGFLLDLYL